jgi:DNA-binding response OmpR family regulator
MPASAPRKFLIVDDNADSRTYLAKTLLRKYKNAVVQECQSGDTATAILRAEHVNAVIAHRTFDYDGETLVRLIRRIAPKVAIVMVSGFDRQAKAREAGADAFMHFDAWLTVGSVVAEAMAARERANEAGAKKPGVSSRETEPV